MHRTLSPRTADVSAVARRTAMSVPTCPADPHLDALQDLAGVVHVDRRGAQQRGRLDGAGRGAVGRVLERACGVKPAKRLGHGDLGLRAGPGIASHEHVSQTPRKRAHWQAFAWGWRTCRARRAPAAHLGRDLLGAELVDALEGGGAAAGGGVASRARGVGVALRRPGNHMA